MTGVFSFALGRVFEEGCAAELILGLVCFTGELYLFFSSCLGHRFHGAFFVK